MTQYICSGEDLTSVALGGFLFGMIFVLIVAGAIYLLKE